MLQQNGVRLALAALCVSFTLALAPAVAPAAPPGIAVRAASPCDGITTSPTSPVGPGEPDIAGHVLEAGTLDGIPGATTRLYVCDGATPSLVAEATTTTGGGFVFVDVEGPAWYYVQAVLTGPLSGKTPADGTVNPSALIEVGAGANDVVFVFEE